MIKLENVSKKYGEFFALRGIDLSIDEGEFIAITGNSGSGKSTLLNIIGQIEDCDSGDVFIDGSSIFNLSEKQRNKIRNEKLGFVFQSFYLELLYPVYKNIEIPLIIAGLNKQTRMQKVNTVLELVNLTSKKNNLCSTLSGGEKQRAAIARALVCDPNIIIADEPCGNLDSSNTKIVLDYLKEINRMGKTVILVTHNTDDLKYANRIVRLQDGEIEYDKKNV